MLGSPLLTEQWHAGTCWRAHCSQSSGTPGGWLVIALLTEQWHATSPVNRAPVHAEGSFLQALRQRRVRVAAAREVFG